MELVFWGFWLFGWVGGGVFKIVIPSASAALVFFYYRFYKCRDIYGDVFVLLASIIDSLPN